MRRLTAGTQAMRACLKGYASTRDRRVLAVARSLLPLGHCPSEAQIEMVRSSLVKRQDHTHQDWTDRPIGKHAQVTPVNLRWGRFLYRLTRTTAPRSVIEMGTSVGISGSFIAAGLPADGRLITLEGDPVVAGVAEETFAGLGVADSVEVRPGRFEDTLGQALADAEPVGLMFIDGHHQEGPTLAYLEQSLPFLAPGALVVFDDIEWSDGMRRAWQRIGQHEATRFAVGLRKLGVWGPLLKRA